MAKLTPNQVYPSDLTDEQWARLEPVLATRTGPGRPQRYPLRLIINAILYLLRSGCQWRMLPRDYPQWTTVRSHVDTWQRDGCWERVNTALRERVRQAAGREPTPSAGILDSQSVTTSEAGGERGFDGGKKGRRPPAARAGGHARAAAGGAGDTGRCACCRCRI